MHPVPLLEVPLLEVLPPSRHQAHWQHVPHTRLPLAFPSLPPTFQPLPPSLPPGGWLRPPPLPPLTLHHMPLEEGNEKGGHWAPPRQREESLCCTGWGRTQEGGLELVQPSRPSLQPESPKAPERSQALPLRSAAQSPFPDGAGGWPGTTRAACPLVGSGLERPFSGRSPSAAQPLRRRAERGNQKGLGPGQAGLLQMLVLEGKAFITFQRTLTRKNPTPTPPPKWPGTCESSSPRHQRPRERVKRR